MKTYRQTAVNAVILSVIIFLFLYMGIQLSRNFSTGISTQRTQLITDSEYIPLSGYVFRDEERIIADGDVVYRLFLNGEKVGVGQKYAEIYSSAGLGPDDIKYTQDSLDSLSKRIALIENGLNESRTLGSLSSVNDSILKAYYAYTDAIRDNDYSIAEIYGKQLVSSLVEHSALTSGEATENALKTLKAEREAILTSLGSDGEALVSDRSFNFFHSTDGYEEIFNSSKLDELSVDELDRLISTAPEATDDGVIGRRVLSVKWYLAVPADEATYLSFSVGQTYDVVLSGNGVETDMYLERICIDPDNEERAYMLFSSLDMSVAGDLSRAQGVRIHLDDRTGYRIPVEAMHEKDGMSGVYVLIGNIVEFRRVTVIGEGEGYYIVNSYSASMAEESTSTTPYLNINDMIITSGNDLYDGKHLD